MTAPDAVEGPAPWRLAALAADALRGIGRREVTAAVVLGLVVTAADALSFFRMLFIDAQNVSVPVMLTDMAIANQVRAFALMAAVVIADRAVDLGASMRRAYVAAALGGSLLGVLLSWVTSWPFQAWMLANAWPKHWLRGTELLLFAPLFALTHWLLIASAAVFLYADWRAARRTVARLNAAQLDRIRASRAALESRLQAMQARVEPRFLFNTLAQVEQLFELDPPTAARMLDDLIAYLRAAMPLMRDTSSTVAQEVELARAYLDIVRQRLGGRLEVAIDVPPDVGGARMPPMMLLPLVDHAIVRGLQPGRAEGRVRIAATTSGGRLRMTIEDSGAGFVMDADGGAIDAIRQRLHALYGADATLELQRRDDRATEAVLELPLEARERFDEPPVDAR